MPSKKVSRTYLYHLKQSNVQGTNLRQQIMVGTCYIDLQHNQCSNQPVCRLDNAIRKINLIGTFIYAVYTNLKLYFLSQYFETIIKLLRHVLRVNVYHQVCKALAFVLFLLCLAQELNLNSNSSIFGITIISIALQT